MNYRTIIDMKNNNALITKAMLASYINEQKVDYLDLISPFILKSLPEQIGEIIDIKDISEKVYKIYGIDIKQKIVEKILIRLCKEKYNRLIRRQTIHGDALRNVGTTKNYFVNSKIDNTKFDQRKDSMNQLVIDVVTKLKDYINNKYNIIPISYECAQEYFLNFLNDYNYELYSNIDDIRLIRNFEKNDKNNIKVASFILDEYKSANGCYNKIKTIQEGYFVSVAIYYFCNSSHIDDPKKLIDNVKIILDTRLLIDVLGLNRESETLSMREFVNLVETNNGKLYTFKYYVDELAGIIHRYAFDPNSRFLLDLDYFRRNKCNNTEVILWRDTLTEKLKNRGVEIIDNIDYNKQIEEKSWHMDPLELKRNMSSFIDYAQGTSGQAFNNDFETLQRISLLKFNNVKYRTQKAIFVTSNIGLIKAAEKTFTDSIFHDEIGIVVSDIDLASILWLSNYNPDSQLSDLILLENAYAATCPSKDIISEVIRIIDKNINGKNEEIRNEALLLRYNENLLSDIAELTNNDKELVDSDIYDKLYDKFEQRIKIKLKPEVKKEVEGTVTEQLTKCMLNDAKRIIKNAEEDVRKKENRIKEMQKINDFKNAELQKIKTEKNLQSLELDNRKRENRELSEENKRMRDNERKRCEKKASNISNIVKFISSFVVSALFILVMYYFILSLTRSILKDEISDMINFGVTIVGTLLTYYPVYKFIVSGLIRKLSNRLKDYLFDLFCRRSVILNKN